MASCAAPPKSCAHRASITRDAQAAVIMSRLGAVVERADGGFSREALMRLKFAVAALCGLGIVASTPIVHAQARRSSPQSVAATCTDCHGTHDIRPSSDPDSRTNHFNLPATCGRWLVRLPDN